MSKEFKNYLKCPPEELRVLLAGKDVNKVVLETRDSYWDKIMDDPDADDSFRDYVYENYLEGNSDEDWEDAYERAYADLTTTTSLFVTTVQKGDVERARVLIELGADLLTCDSVASPGFYARDGFTWPVLNVAITFRNVEMVNLLLDSGADPNFTGTVMHPFRDGKEVTINDTAGFAWAWTCNDYYGNESYKLSPRDLAVLELLAGAGAHLGDALTTIVKQMNSVELAKALELGIDPNSKDEGGRSPLSYIEFPEDDMDDPEDIARMAELLRQYGATS